MYKIEIWSHFKKIAKSWWRPISSFFRGKNPPPTIPQPPKTHSLERMPPISLPEKPQSSDWMRGQLFQEMQRFIRTQRSKHTQRAYTGDLKQFIGWIRAGDFSPNSLDALIEFRDWLVRPIDEGGKNLSKISANRKIATVRSFLNWLQSRGFIDENPANWVKNFRAQTESPTQGFSDLQVTQILRMTNKHTKSGVMHFFILNLLFYMGLRRGELVQLRCSSIGQTRVGEELMTTLKVLGKGDKERLLPIPKPVIKAMDLYFTTFRLKYGSDDFLFRAVRNNITKRFDQPIDGNSVAYIVKKYAKMAGIETRVSPHSCRATCISNALEQGATQKSVQDMAGWSSTLMIERYDKRETKLRDSAVHAVNYPD